MSIETIRTQVKTILEAITGVENVHEYKRNIRDPEEFQDEYLDEENKINAWVLLSREMEPEYYACRTYENFYEFTLIHYHGLVDDSETQLTVENLVSTVMDGFKTNRTLNNTASTSKIGESDIDDGRLGDTRVHVATIPLIASDFSTGVNYS